MSSKYYFYRLLFYSTGARTHDLPTTFKTSASVFTQPRLVKVNDLKYIASSVNFCQ